MELELRGKVYSVRYYSKNKDGQRVRVRLTDPSWTVDRGVKWVRLQAEKAIERDKLAKSSPAASQQPADEMLASALTAFCVDLRRRFKASTVAGYEEIIRRRFLTPCHGLPLSMVFSLTGSDRLRDALESPPHLEDKARAVSKIRSFARWLARRESLSAQSEEEFERVLPEYCQLSNKSANARVNFWTAAEWDSFCATFRDGDPWLLVFETMFWGALRLGELRALKVSSFDRLKNTLMVSASITAGGVESSPKTASSLAVVDLPSWLAKELERAVAGRPAGDYLFRIGGRRVSATGLRRAFNAHVSLAGVHRITVHGLRHSIASRMIQEGVEPLIVSRHLRHSSLAITLSVYTHLFPGVAAGIMDRISPTKSPVGLNLEKMKKNIK